VAQVVCAAVTLWQGVATKMVNGGTWLRTDHTPTGSAAKPGNTTQVLLIVAAANVVEHRGGGPPGPPKAASSIIMERSVIVSVFVSSWPLGVLILKVEFDSSEKLVVVVGLVVVVCARGLYRKDGEKGRRAECMLCTDSQSTPHAANVAASTVSCPLEPSSAFGP